MITPRYLRKLYCPTRKHSVKPVRKRDFVFIDLEKQQVLLCSSPRFLTAYEKDMQIQVNLSMMQSKLIYLFARVDRFEWIREAQHALECQLVSVDYHEPCVMSYNHRKGDFPTEKILAERLTSACQEIRMFILQLADRWEPVTSRDWKVSFVERKWKNQTKDRWIFLIELWLWNEPSTR